MTWALEWFDIHTHAPCANGQRIILSREKMPLVPPVSISDTLMTFSLIANRGAEHVCCSTYRAVVPSALKQAQPT